MKLILFLISIFTINFSYACEICGCGIAGSNINGIIPQFNKNIIGVRISHVSFNHPNTPQNYNGLNRVMYDQYVNYDAWFRFYPNKRIQTMFLLPFKNISRKQDNNTYNIKGIGDANAFLNYSILKIKDSIEQNLMWWTGVGIKVPTGKYQQRDNEKTMFPIGLQTGNGAYAFYLNNQLTYKYKNLIFNSISQYMINGKNELDYQLGNIFSTQLQLMNKFRIGCDAYLIPNLSIEYSKAEKDKLYGITNFYSGNTLSSLNIGIDWFFNSFFVSATIKKPQQWNKYYSQPIQQINGSINLGYFLK